MKKWALGAALIGLGGCTLFYLFSEEKRPSQMTLSRTVLLSLLKELKRELTGPLISLANMSKWVKAEFNFSRQSDIENMVRSNCKLQSANFIQQIEMIQDRIFLRYNLSKPQVEAALEEEFLNDQEVQSQVKEIKEAIRSAYAGEIPKLENSIPAFVNEQLVLSVLNEIYKFTLTTAFEKIQELKNRGVKIEIRSQEMNSVENEIEELVECEKQMIFKKFGLLYLEDSPSMIIHTAGQVFAKKSQDFSRKMGRIEEEYRNNLELIMKGRMSEEQILALR